MKTGTINSGSGQFANMLLDHGCTNYVGIDFSEKAIELAKRATPGYVDQFICADAFSFLETHKKENYKLPIGSMVIFSVPNFKSFNHVRTFDFLESIKNRYQMLDISRYQEMPANKNADKVYHLVFATLREVHHD